MFWVQEYHPIQLGYNLALPFNLTYLQVELRDLPFSCDLQLYRFSPWGCLALWCKRNVIMHIQVILISSHSPNMLGLRFSFLIVMTNLPSNVSLEALVIHSTKSSAASLTPTYNKSITIHSHMIHPSPIIAKKQPIFCLQLGGSLDKN